MPGRGTHKVIFRIPEALWQRFGDVAIPDRSTLIREFIRWYVREKGAKLPPRPAP